MIHIDTSADLNDEADMSRLGLNQRIYWNASQCRAEATAIIEDPNQCTGGGTSFSDRPSGSSAPLPGYEVDNFDDGQANPCPILVGWVWSKKLFEDWGLVYSPEIDLTVTGGGGLHPRSRAVTTGSTTATSVTTTSRGHRSRCTAVTQACLPSCAPVRRDP